MWGKCEGITRPVHIVDWSSSSGGGFYRQGQQTPHGDWDWAFLGQWYLLLCSCFCPHFYFFCVIILICYHHPLLTHTLLLPLVITHIQETFSTIPAKQGRGKEGATEIVRAGCEWMRKKKKLQQSTGAAFVYQILYKQQQQKFNKNNATTIMQQQ